MSIHPHRREGSGGVRELSMALGITAGIMVVEIAAGLVSGSMALLADAGHMLTDASAMGLALFAAWITTKPATLDKTYGYYRTEILAALVNGVALWLLVIWIWTRAFHRLQHPPEVRTGLMLLAAVVGLAANLFSSAILSRATQATLNVKGARLHVLADALGSCGVIVAGLLIRFKGWMLADPVAGMVIGALVALSSWVLIKQSVNVLLEGTPAHLDLDTITQAIGRVPGVRDVHDVHLWTITTGMEAMSAHVRVARAADDGAILDELNRVLSDRFGITHTTFQLEPHEAV